MIHIKCVVPECHIDTRLVQLLLGENERPNHQHGKGEVLNTLNTALKNNIAFGIIDEDKNKGAKPKLLNGFSEIIKKENDHFLEIKKHLTNSHHLIIICPEIEKWLMGACTEIGLNPMEYDLPLELKGLKEVSKSKEIEKHLGFRRLVSALEHNNSARIMCLKKWLWGLAQK